MIADRPVGLWYTVWKNVIDTHTDKVTVNASCVRMRTSRW